MRGPHRSVAGLGVGRLTRVATWTPEAPGAFSPGPWSRAFVGAPSRATPRASLGVTHDAVPRATTGDDVVGYERYAEIS